MWQEMINHPMVLSRTALKMPNVSFSQSPVGPGKILAALGSEIIRSNAHTHDKWNVYVIWGLFPPQNEWSLSCRPGETTNQHIT